MTVSQSSELKTLRIVPGHAIYLGGEPLQNEHWILLPWQADPDRRHLRCFREHVRAACTEHQYDPSGMLVFSGGFTRPGAAISEARSYQNLAIADGLLPTFDDPSLNRVVLDEEARDSFENIVRAIAIAYVDRNFVPTRVEVYGFQFKWRRFEHHARTIGLDCDFVYFGLNNPPDLAAARAGERDALRAFEADPHGVGPELYAKRQTRNPLRRFRELAPRCDGWPALQRALAINEAPDLGTWNASAAS